MFVITDGAPNRWHGSGTTDLTSYGDWLTAANKAIAAADYARDGQLPRQGALRRHRRRRRPQHDLGRMQRHEPRLLVSEGHDGHRGWQLLQPLEFNQLLQTLLTESGCTDIVLTKTSNGPIDAGNQGSFTISIKNNGSQASDPGTITDVLPADIDWSIDPAVAGCSLSGTGIGSDAKVLTCDVPALDPNGTEVLSVTVVADFPNAAGYCADLPNTAEFTYDGNTSGTPDKSASATLTIENCPTTGSISGSKYNDLNGNSEVDNGEPKLSNWTIQLKDDGGNVVASTTTSNGDYSFSNVTPGLYHVCEVQQSGWIATLPPPDACWTVDLASGQDVTAANFLNRQVGTIIIRKATVGGNGTFQFDGDLGGFQLVVPGSASTTFPNKAPGTYLVHEIVPTGWDLTSINCGANQNNTGAVDGINIVLEAGETVDCTFNNTKLQPLVVSKTAETTWTRDNDWTI